MLAGFSGTGFNIPLTSTFAQMSETLTITQATVADAKILTELSVTTFTEAFGANNRKEDMDKYIASAMSVPAIGAELADGNNVFFLAWYENELAGYAKLGYNQKPEAKDLEAPVELERIYVLKKFYGKKTGAALMEKCLAHATAHGDTVMWLGVWQQNHRAVSFYKQWGFEFYGTHQFVLGDDVQTDELMKKDL
ncbi:MAG: spermine/spermidine N-acetyltransferase [Flavipsychrobacter sp.]|jgi:GNAT superfamily N-acetyltransferase|nr:spermine/spermidine N-acetyltransferase [Flavipsychrobacter sp.]